MHKQRGYVFPLILLATLAVGVFVATVGQLQISHKKQFNHLDRYQHSFNIAYSALVEVLADLQATRWSNRSFKTKPIGYSKDLFGGTFNLLAENHGTDNLTFNVKIRVVYQEMTNLFYWRLKYDPSLLDFDSFVIPQYFSQFEDSSAPGYLEELDNLIDAELASKNDNKTKAKEIFTVIDAQTTPANVLEAIGAIEKNSGVEIAGADITRPEDLEIALSPDSEPNKKLTEVINETEGAETPSLEEVISSLPLNDIYPDKIDVNIGLTRKEIVVFFVRVLQLPEISSAAAIEAFPDITSDSIYNRALGAARECDPYLVVGHTDGLFHPDEFILRGHMALLLTKSHAIATIKLQDPGLSSVQRSRLEIIKSFADEKIPGYLEENPHVAMTVGDGLGALSKLLEKINAVK